jgi:hypothetical protein
MTCSDVPAATLLLAPPPLLDDPGCPPAPTSIASTSPGDAANAASVTSAPLPPGTGVPGPFAVLMPPAPPAPTTVTLIEVMPSPDGTVNVSAPREAYVQVTVSPLTPNTPLFPQGPVAEAGVVGTTASHARLNPPQASTVVSASVIDRRNRRVEKDSIEILPYRFGALYISAGPEPQLS